MPLPALHFQLVPVVLSLCCNQSCRHLEIIIWHARLNKIFLMLFFLCLFFQGLIKIRGDHCWRDLTCMNYHYEVSNLHFKTVFSCLLCFGGFFCSLFFTTRQFSMLVFFYCCLQPIAMLSAFMCQLIDAVFPNNSPQRAISVLPHCRGLLGINVNCTENSLCKSKEREEQKGLSRSTVLRAFCQHFTLFQNSDICRQK